MTVGLPLVTFALEGTVTTGSSALLSDVTGVTIGF